MAAALAAIVAFPQWTFKLDTTFKTQITQQNVNSIFIRDDGQIIISGQIKFPGDMSVRSGALLGTNGERNTNFAEVAFMGGKITPWNNKYYSGNGNIVRRHQTNGDLDQDFIMLNWGPYFSSGSGGDYHVFEDGRVLITGNHLLSDSVRGFVGSYKLIWFSNEGYLDTTRIHRQANGVMWRFTALPDGKFLCSCSCTMYDGQPVGRVFRIHADGALDTTFQTDIYAGNIRAYHPLADGRVIVGGDFWSASDPDQLLQLVRFMPDGSFDPTFNNHLAFGLADGLNGAPRVTRIVQWQDDKYFVTGTFRNVDGETRGGICVVDTSGQLLPFMDECLTGPFTFMGNTSASIHGITPTLDGTGFYINGTYAGYSDGIINDTLQRFVSRLLVEEVNVAVQETSEPSHSFSIHPNPASGMVTFTSDIRSDQGLVMIHDASGRLIQQVPFGSPSITLDLRLLEPGLYLVAHVVDGVVLDSRKLVLE